ncbi:hypothetical protein [Arcobacter sp.]|uniref:hypothetical protein n=1 Tax=Arcobacter sp. TaxID=1872629 RepID=UPI003D0DF2BA
MSAKRIIDIIKDDKNFNSKSDLDYFGLINIFLRLDIICPNENHWFILWEDLKNYSQDKEYLPIAYVATSWHYTTDTQKRERFFEHLKFAEEKNVLKKAINYLLNLTIDDFNIELNFYF